MAEALADHGGWNEMPVPLNKSELVAVILLRITGITGLFAIPPIFFPYRWMDACHRFLGLGTLPDVPIVSYLTRSLSAFYALVSIFMLCISLDVRRYRPLVKLWGYMAIVLGVVLVFIDAWSGLPWLWSLVEGPMTVVAGAVLLVAHRGIRTSEV